jgi:hypothetical protein
MEPTFKSPDQSIDTSVFFTSVKRFGQVALFRNGLIRERTGVKLTDGEVFDLEASKLKSSKAEKIAS